MVCIQIRLCAHPFRSTLLHLAVLAVLGPGLSSAPLQHSEGFSTIEKKDLEAHLVQLASPELEGRDTPSAGLSRAAEYLSSQLQSVGFKPLVGESFLWEYEQSLTANRSSLWVPIPERCSLTFGPTGEKPEELSYGADFVPVAGTHGVAEGEPIFLGYGIDSKREPYNDLKGREYQGKIAVILEGEPRHRRLFEGREITREANLYAKVRELEERKVLGVLCVRRKPEKPKKKSKYKYEGEPLPISFRHSWAWFIGLEPVVIREMAIPVLEITPAAAQRILGVDVLELAEEIDSRGKPLRHLAEGRHVKMSAESKPGPVAVNNVIALLPGSDPELSQEYVILGAHYDHLGIDSLGRMGPGADDNGSGTATVLEVSMAMAAAKPKRSIIAAFFAGEEDGLFGSKAFCDNLPVEGSSVVAMLNMDMLGRGEVDEVLALGTQQNPDLEKVLIRAKKLKSTRIKKVVTNRGQDLFQRSDHYWFHKIGIPSLFFYEGWPESNNPDYHTWNDTIDKLDFEKITRSARLIYNTAWLLANDEERPSAPR